MNNDAIYTIGHSTLSYAEFLHRLKSNGVTAVADVRSSPFSKHFPHFNKGPLRSALRKDGISYVFLGAELGGRPSETDMYRAGVADYEAMATREEFRLGINRVMEGAERHRIALLCSEQDPLDCHRFLLVGRALAARCVHVCHILPNGKLASQDEIEQRLLQLGGRAEGDLFLLPAERLNAAYRERANKVAYSSSDAANAELRAFRSKKIG